MTDQVKVHKVQAAEFRQNIKDIIRSLENGNDVYVLTHYNKIVGYLTHRVPPHIQKRMTSKKSAKISAKSEPVETVRE